MENNNAQGRYLTISEISNGNLFISATKDGRDLLNLLRQAYSNETMWSELLEDLRANYSYQLIAPAEVGALTEAPIIAWEVENDDYGSQIVIGDCWWFPDYMIIDELEKLMNGETVIFTKAESFEN